MQLEDRINPSGSDVLAGGLDFHAVNGTFDSSGITTANVQVGFAPSGNQALIPLVLLTGTIATQSPPGAALDQVFAQIATDMDDCGDSSGR